MNIPQIQIHQQFAQIGINISPSQMNVERRDPHVQTEYIPPEMEISYQPPQLETDWRRVWDEIGLKHALDVSREYRDRAKQKALASIAQMAQLGDRLGNIASGEKNALARFYFEKFSTNQRVETTLVAIPSQGPDIRFDITPPDIQIQEGGAVVNPVDASPLIQYKISQLDIYLRQKPHVDITV
jgi:hypothetical protein